MNRDELLNRYFIAVCQEGLFSSPENLKYYTNNLFRDIDFAGKAMVDVGGGSGRFSFYAACMGASKVVCLEPGASGFNPHAFEKFQKLADSLLLAQVRYEHVTLQKYDPGSDLFDIILLHDSVNHLDAESCKNLQHDNCAIRGYRALFQKLYDMAREEAVLIITDNSRYNFFHLLHIKNPFVPTIGWEYHQPPQFWASLLSEVGFTSPVIRWTTPNRLHWFGRKLFGNPIASYFLTSHFCLSMTKTVKRM